MSIDVYFPYRYYRKGQLESINFIKEVLKERAIGLLHAPTGIGKTIAALVSYLSFKEQNPDAKLVILTRTKSQMFMYVKETERIKRKKNLSINYVTFRSKKDMCLIALRSEKIKGLPYHAFLKACEVLKRKQKCSFFRKSYDSGMPSDRLVQAAQEVLITGASYLNIVNKASKYGVCPYEIARYLAPQADIVIGSYSYIFNPDVREKFLSTINETLKSIYILIDEAHNLPDYIINALSLSLSIRAIEAAKKELYVSSYEDSEYLVEILDTISEKISEIGDRELGRKFKSPKIIDPKTISSLYSKKDYLDLRNIGEKIIEMSGEFYTRLIWISDFLEYFKLLSDLDEFITTIELIQLDKGKTDYILSLQLLDPSREAQIIFNEALSAVLMSGSLYPIDYFERVLGLKEKIDIKNRIRELIIPFPFNPDSLLILVDRVCTTKYDMRTDRMFNMIANRIEAISDSIRNNKAILIVFPSYELLKIITFKTRIRDKNMIIETPKTEIEYVLNELKNHPDSIIFCVAGGKLMEGIDYRINDKTLLAAVVMVGLPFPEWNDVIRAQEKYFSKKFGEREGRFLTIISPAIRKTIQAGGRLVRSEEDKGIIVIIDRRYREYDYWKLFPPWWRRFRTFINSEELAEIIRNFF